MQQNNAARGGRRQRRDRLGQKLHEHGQNNGHEKGNMFTVLAVCLTPALMDSKLESKENSLYSRTVFQLVFERATKKMAFWLFSGFFFVRCHEARDAALASSNARHTTG